MTNTSILTRISTCLQSNRKLTKEEDKILNAAIINPSPSKRILFEKDSEHWIINNYKIYIEFSLDLPKPNLEIYHKLL